MCKSLLRPFFLAAVHSILNDLEMTNSTDQLDNEQVFQERNINERDTLERNIVEHEPEVDGHVEQEEFNEDYDHNSWTATGPMADLPTNIFKKNSLSSSS